MTTFAQAIAPYGPLVSAPQLTTLQCNVTRRCNLTCAHCHVEAGPSRKEDMTFETADLLIAAFKKGGFETLDITGGAPELSKVTPHLISSLRPVAKKIILRTNLVVLKTPALQPLKSFFADHQVELVASLPFYQREKTDKMRGPGVYDDSIAVLQELNALGYGKDENLKLHLVFNPAGAFLPSDQQELKAQYVDLLGSRYQITFNDLYTITNMPLGNFAAWLKSRGLKEEYEARLRAAFNSATLEGLMCRHQISVDYDGRLYDCDFHLATGTPLALATNHLRHLTQSPLAQRKIQLRDYCFGCTAGAGST